MERHRGRKVVGIARGIGVTWQLGTLRDRDPVRPPTCAADHLVCFTKKTEFSALPSLSQSPLEPPSLVVRPGSYFRICLVVGAESAD